MSSSGSMATSRKLSAAASLAAKQVLGGFGPGQGDVDGGALPWEIVGEKLAELLRFLASAAQALAAELRERAASLLAVLASLLARAALPAAAAVAVLLVLCGCCAAAGRRRRRGPDGEEVEGLGGGGGDGPVLSYRRGGYRGGIFSMHPNKPIVG